MRYAQLMARLLTAPVCIMLCKIKKSEENSQ
nr:MAG TPA: hypothetical protein [Caudoviricetes sp.]